MLKLLAALAALALAGCGPTIPDQPTGTGRAVGALDVPGCGPGPCGSIQMLDVEGTRCIVVTQPHGVALSCDWK